MKVKKNGETRYLGLVFMCQLDQITWEIWVLAERLWEKPRVDMKYLAEEFFLYKIVIKNLFIQSISFCLAPTFFSAWFIESDNDLDMTSRN